MKKPGTLILFALALLLLTAAAPASAPLAVVPVSAPFACHTQGITVARGFLFVTCAQREKKRALLLRYRLPENFPAAGLTLSAPEVTDFTRGSQWHPSGLDHDDRCLWLAVADYQPRFAHSTMLCVNPETLKVESEFPIADHIGTVAAVGGEVWGMNWDARTIYRFGKDGKPIGQAPSPSKVAFQDCSGGPVFALCSGPDRERKQAAAVERLTVKGSEFVSARVGRCESEGVTVGREGFAALNGSWAFLPDDLPSARLFFFAPPP